MGGSRHPEGLERAFSQRRGTPTLVVDGWFPALLVSAFFRRAVPLACLGACLTLLPGCYAGLAALVVGALALSDQGGGNGGTDAPPVLASFSIEPSGSPDRILIRFAYGNEDQGKLGAAVEFALLDGTGVSAPRTLHRATLAADADPVDLADIPTGEEVLFHWDAGLDLAGGSGQVEVVLTPFEDGRRGPSFTSEPFTAGNTRVELGNMVLSSVNELVVVNFVVVDAESNPARLVPFDCEEAGVMIDIGEGFTPLPRQLFETLRKEFPSAPGPGGAQASFSFLITDLKPPGSEPGDVCPGQEALGRLGAPGFVGPVRIRIAIHDFSLEPPTTVESDPILVDNNEPPLVELLPIEPGDLGSGVVPIRYRLYDKGSELNPAGIRVEFKMEAETDYRRANELPAPPSGGTSGLSTADIASFGVEGSPFHTFLWDAGSQLRSAEKVFIRVSAFDMEDGPESLPQTIAGFSLAPFGGPAELVTVGDGPSTLTAADYDLDGFLDVVVTRRSAGAATVVRARDGLEARSTLDVGPRPAAVSSGDFDDDGFPDLAVASEGSDLVPSRLTVFRGGIEGLSGARAVSIDLGPQALPVALVQGHLDEDGSPDLVVVKGGTGRVAFLKVRRDGLHAAAEVDVGSDPGPLAIDDFDGDGRLDLAIAKRGFRPKLIYLWGGEKGFPAGGGRTEIDVPGSQTVVMTGKVNDDDLPDAVIAYASSSEVTYLESAPRSDVGNGVLRTVTREAGEESLRAIIGGDFDGDGFLDVAAANRTDIFLLYGDPVEGLLPATGPIQNAGRSIQALAVADFDADGFLDLALASALSNEIAYLLGGPQGLSRVEGRIETGGRFPVALLAADLNGDSAPDLVAANEDSGDLTFLAGRPAGLQGAALLPSRRSPDRLAAGDFNDDGHPDVLAVNSLPAGEGSGTFVTYLEGGTAGLRFAGDIPARRGACAVVTGHFDGDAYADAVVANRLANTVSFLSGGSEGIIAVKDLPVGAGPSAIDSGYMNGDGFLDAVVACEDSDSLSFLPGGPEGPGTPVTIQAGSRPVALTCGDFDGDSFDDVLVANLDSDTIQYLRGGQAESALASSVLLEVIFPAALAHGDFDGDGFLDAVVASAAGAVVLFRGGVDGLIDGEGRRAVIAVGEGAAAVATADFDGDGFLDAGVACAASGSVTCLRGGPDGLTGERTTEVAAGPFPGGIAAGDLDGDGFPDALIATGGGDHTAILRGGQGGLSEAAGRRALVRTGRQPAQAALGDFDGDGFLDAAVANQGSSEVAYLNQRFLLRHANALVSKADNASTVSLLDPREPPAHRLDIPPGAIAGPDPSQVCLVPAVLPPLPQAESAREGNFLVAVSDCLRVLGGTARFEPPARLTLAFRPGGPDPSTGRLLVFRGENAAGAPLEELLGPADIQPVLLDGTPAAAFPVAGAGCYVLVLEVKR